MTALKRLFIANRGEIAIRIARTAAEMGLQTVAVHSCDDAASLHTRIADTSVATDAAGPAAYLDTAALVRLAKRFDCDAIHPGYGFASENASFASQCAESGIAFVGPSPEALALFGNKSAARDFAIAHDVPVIPGTQGGIDLAEAERFVASLEPEAQVMIKSVAGGGGRGTRELSDRTSLSAIFAQCRDEALASFGDGRLYVERLVPRARHIEVQILGDGTGAVTHLWDRECSLQRERQKLIEIAPALNIPDDLRLELLEAATRMASAAEFRGVGTFEFLVDASTHPAIPRFAFIEANPRLQVEHTVTEEITGLDIVRAQLMIASGLRLDEIGLQQASVPPPRGIAVQTRINMESVDKDGRLHPSSGTLDLYEPPSGRGIRVDGYGYSGYTVNPRFDSLLAKLIVHATTGGIADVFAKAHRALGEFRVGGVETNIGTLQALLRHPSVIELDIHTRFVNEHRSQLSSSQHLRGFEWSERNGLDTAAQAEDIKEPYVALRAPMQGVVARISGDVGGLLPCGKAVFLIESMKMEHTVSMELSGIIREICVAANDSVSEGQVLAIIEPHNANDEPDYSETEYELDHIRDDLQTVLNRQWKMKDEARPSAVAKRHDKGKRTARENITDLVDEDSFTEYGSTVLAARLRTQSVDELVDESPADGLVTGTASINRSIFPANPCRCVVAAYDYTVYAGTQGHHSHLKLDRMLELADRNRLPVVLFTEGGGGRGSDSDALSNRSGLTFQRLARLSGLVPTIGIASGRCFAGNAVLLGCCDVIIATEDATMGMGGPAMIEGGGLGIFRPEEVGPAHIQAANGVIDILVRDEPSASKTARQYLSYFQGPVTDWECDDQRRLRHIVPEERLRSYDMRELITTLADKNSMLELRAGFGPGMITALIRIEGKPLGVIANNPRHLGGAIDAAGADKAARFMQLCDAHDIPLLSLNDNPGNMVGPEAEKEALIRHCCRSFLVGANMTIPTFMVCVRKSYGLGKLAMTGGSIAQGIFAVSWPTGEFAGMGLEGQVKLGRRKELAAISDPASRQAAFEKMVEELYERSRALNEATVFGVDEIIDPADTRRWILSGLETAAPPAPRTGKKRPCVDGW